MSSGVKIDSSGMDDLLKMIEDLSFSDEDILKAMDIAGEELAADARKLGKPIREVNKPGYTHMINSITSRRSRRNGEVEIGWGKYYGRMVESGTKKMNAQAHLVPLYNRNQDKYVKTIKDALHLGD